MPGCIDLPGEFLSTPSGWRATHVEDRAGRAAKFLSTPSGWRATGTKNESYLYSAISIHALRVEGDIEYLKKSIEFERISIHALRVEGDMSICRFL